MGGANPVAFTNLGKVFWPAEGYTKGDLVEYYRAVAPAMLPYLRDRPLVLDRYPDGIAGKSFYQKNAPVAAAGRVRTVTIHAGGSERDIELVLVRSRSSTDGQKCALPTGESLLMQSLVQVFDEEFRRHIGADCPLPRELPFHKIVDRDRSGRFVYDVDYVHRQPDWTYA